MYVWLFWILAAMFSLGNYLSARMGRKLAEQRRQLAKTIDESLELVGMNIFLGEEDAALKMLHSARESVQTLGGIHARTS